MSIKKIIVWLENISLCSLGGMVFAVPFSSHFVRRFFFLSLGIIIIKKIFAVASGLEPVFKKNYLNKPILIFILAMLLAALFGASFYESQKVFIERILFYVGIFFVIKESVDTKKKVYFFLGVIGVSAFVVGIDALWQYFTGFDLFFGYPKNDPGVGQAIAVSGPFGSYNFFSGYLELILPMIVFLSFIRQRLTARIFFWVTVGMLLFSWVYVFERGSWVSVIVSIIIISFLVNRKYTIGFLLFFVIVSLLLPVPAYQRIKETFRENGDSERFVMWEAGLEAFNERALFGQGLGGYARYPFIRDKKILHAHNTYLELLADAGVVGLVSFLYLLVVFLRRAFFSVSNIADGKKKLILGGLIASCLSYFISGLFSTNMIVGVGMSALFWTILSLTTVLPGISFQEQR